MANDLPPLSGRLRELRSSKGMTQQQLAVAAGLSVSLVSQIEQGANPDPKMSTVQSLARALGVSIVDLTGEGTPRGTDAPKAPPSTPPAADLEAEGKRHGPKPAEGPAKKPRERKGK